MLQLQPAHFVSKICAVNGPINIGLNFFSDNTIQSHSYQCGHFDAITVSRKGYKFILESGINNQYSGPLNQADDWIQLRMLAVSNKIGNLELIHLSADILRTIATNGMFVRHA